MLNLEQGDIVLPIVQVGILHNKRREMTVRWVIAQSRCIGIIIDQVRKLENERRRMTVQCEVGNS